MGSKRYPMPIRAVSIIFSQVKVPVGKEGMARVFAVRVQSWLSITSVAVQS